MAELHLTQALLTHWPIVLAILSIAYLTKQYFNRGLNRYPGPFLANFTDTWRAWDVSKNHHAETLIELHERYGPIIRTGPNTLDLSDPSLVATIYGIHKGFEKTSFYETFRNYNRGKLTNSLLTARDGRFHTALKRPVAPMYSLSGVTEYEPLVDATIEDFISRLDEEFGRGDVPCDLGQWLHYMAFDLILNMTFGSTLGFLKQGADASGFIAGLEANFDETAICTQMPWFRFVKRHNPLRALLARDHSVFPGFVRQQLVEHQAKLADIKDGADNSSSTDPNGQTPPLGSYGADFLTRFLQLPGVTPDKALSYALSNVFAGSDTTAITLRAIVYFLLKNPPKHHRLLAEIRAAKLSSPVTWRESQTLPYLHAVISESLRLFPAVGLSLERAVPATGLQVDDETSIPAGTAVGMNAWVVHRDAKIFGPLPTDEFHPERWLRQSGADNKQGKEGEESEEAFENRRAAMHRADLAFGYVHSPRMCMGRHIAQLEIYKLVPTLFLEFDVSLQHPDQEWTYVNRWFVRQAGLVCWLKRRVR